MLNFDNIYLGQRVKTGQQLNAQQFIVKRIDSEQRMVYIVADAVESWGQWVSGEALFQGV